MAVPQKPVVTVFYGIDDQPRNGCRDEILRYAGGNTGNLLFRYALQERMVDMSNCEVLRLPATSDLFRSLDSSTCRRVLSSALVIYPVANLLRTTEDFEANPNIQRETEFVTHLCQLFQGPFLVMGLGYQARLRSDGALIRDLHPRQVAMLDALLQHTAGITLRGNTTLAVLREQEILRHARLEALGCPSLMISADVDHGRRMASQPPPETISRIALGLPSDPAGFAPLFDWMIQLANDPRVHVVLQDSSDIQACRAAGLPADRLHMFCDLSEWIAFLKSCDVCITARLHGAQVSVLAMTPVLLVATDSRIEELAQMMALNWIAMDDPQLEGLFRQWTSLLQRACAFDGEHYDANRRELALRTTRFLANLGLPAHPNLRMLAGENSVFARWALQKQVESTGPVFADFDIPDYLERYPDPFLHTQNLLGLAFHANKTGNSWSCILPMASCLDVASRISNDLVVLCGWSTDRSAEAQLVCQWSDGKKQVVRLGQIRIRRPDVAEALANGSIPEPDFGFFLAIHCPQSGAVPLRVEIFGQAMPVRLQDWRNLTYGQVADALLDCCQWSHTPSTSLPGLIERDLGVVFRAVMSNVHATSQHDDMHQLIAEMRQMNASMVCIVCLDDVLFARTQLQRLGAYASIKRGELAVVLVLQPNVHCRFCQSTLKSIVARLVREWPSVCVVERRLDCGWQHTIESVKRVGESQFKACAVLGREVLTSEMDWISRLQAHELYSHLATTKIFPTFHDYLSQPLDSEEAYLQKFNQSFYQKSQSRAYAETEALLVERKSLNPDSSVLPQSRDAWRSWVEAEVWR